MHLRQTSKTEKELVDSENYQIDSAEIVLPAETTWIIHNGNLTLFQGQSFEYLLEHGIFKKLEISFARNKRAAETFPKAKRPYSVKNLKFFLSADEDQENINFMLGRMSNELESLEIEPNQFDPSQLDNIFVSSTIPNIQFIKIGPIQVTDTADKLAQVWIEKDVKIGNKYQVLVEKTGSFEGFFQIFKDRLVINSDKFIRIKTENPSKHILLQVFHSTFGYLSGEEEFLQMTVIPAELKEYNEDEEWIRIWEKKYEGAEDDSDEEDEEEEEEEQDEFEWF